MNVCNEATGRSTTVTFKANCSSERDVIGSQRSTVPESSFHPYKSLWTFLCLNLRPHDCVEPQPNRLVPVQLLRFVTAVIQCV